MRYRKDIDGLRAVAIVPVVLFHAGIPGFGGGFVGVDVFFVISGFLITGLLQERLDAGRLSLRDFYERRIRRIFPALVLVLCFVWVVAYAVFLPRDLFQTGRGLLATLFFVANIFFYSQSGYFDAAADTKPLWHMWSLSVEEQFYFVFPLIMIVVQRWYPGRLVRVVAVLAAISFAGSAFAAILFPKAAFYMMPLRMWELATGSLLALGAVRPSSRGRGWWDSLGLALIAVPAVAYSATLPFPGLAAAPPVLGAALLLSDGRDAATTVKRFLQSRVMRYFGLVSYSWYLWHWPMLVFSKYYWFPKPLGAWVCAPIAASLGVSTLSWRFVERRFHRPTARDPQRPILRLAASLTAALAACSALLVVTRGFPSRLPPGAAWEQAADDVNRRNARCHLYPRRSIAIDRSCLYGDASVAPTYAIWGDSFGGELVAVLGERLKAQKRSILQLTSADCPPALRFGYRPFDRCPDRNAEVLTFIRHSKSIEAVILVGDYRRYDIRDYGTSFEDGFRQAVAQLVAAGKTVWIVYPVPTPGVLVPKMIALDAMRGIDPASLRLDRAAYEQGYGGIIAFFDGLIHPHVHKIDLTRILCDRRFCATFANGKVLYRDDRHLSLAGARYVAPAFTPLFDKQVEDGGRPATNPSNAANQ